MDSAYCIRLLGENAQRIGALVRGVSEDEARWKPDAGNWSTLEVVNHLYDEEREDFRVRLAIILNDPDRDWPPINPEGWVTERGYNSRALVESLEDFQSERRSSLEWLKSLESPDWDREYHSRFGSMKAGEMLAAWTTHDQLHMRQLVELQRGMLERRMEGYSLDYAGDW